MECLTTSFVGSMTDGNIISSKRSLSGHLFRTLIPGFVLMLLLSGWIAKTMIGRNMLEEFDRTLDKQAIAIIGITEQDEDGVELEIYQEAMPYYFEANSQEYFEVHDTEGNRLFASETIREHNLGFELPENNIPVFQDIWLPNGSEGRAVRRTYFPKIDIDDEDSGSETDASQPFHIPGEIVKRAGFTIAPTQVVVTAATSRRPLEEVLDELNLILLVTALITTSALVLLQNRAIKRAVRPINALVNSLRARTGSDVTTQLKMDTDIVELDVLSNTFNELLQSVSESMEREKTFSSNLAHEIRTPIAEMQSLLEVNRQWPDDPALRDNLSADLLGSLKRMELLVINILAIGRGESGQLDISGGYDLSKGIESYLLSQKKRVAQRGLTFVLNVDNACIAVKGSQQWPIILTNVLNNAIEYSPSGSEVEISLIQSNDEFQLSFANVTEDLEVDDIERVFDRLWRKDSSRTGEEHSGLGLSLVRTFCQILGYQLNAKVVEGNLFKIVISGESTITHAS